jgi:4-amino-4-deoxy-L-arabinose transferase-like glycosyltransferase
VQVRPLNENFFDSRTSLYLLLLLALILLFNDLSKPGLPSNDDCAKAQRGWEMLKSGDWLTPKLAGKPNFDHPPLYIGMLAASMAVFGKTEFAARFPGVLCAFLVIFVVYLIGKELKDRTTGWLASFLMLTSYIFLKISRRVQADIPFMLLASLAMLFFIRALKRFDYGNKTGIRGIWREFLAFGICAGLSGLIKSVFIIFPLGIPYVVLLFRKQLFKWRLMFPLILSSVIGAVIAGWWYFYEYFKYKNLFVEEFLRKFLKHHAGGGSGMGKYGYFGYVYEFTRHFLPWLPLFLICIWWIARNEKLRKNGSIHLLALYAFIPFLSLSLFGDKAVRYILFIFAPVTLIIALVLVEKIARGNLAKFTAISLILFYVIAAFVIVRPVNYDDVPNSSYLKLSEMLESGRMLLQENMPIYHFGMDADFRANYRGLLYYTERELTGMLRTDEEAANRMKKSGTFYLIVDKRDLTEFLVSNLIVKADLGKSLLMSR